MRYDGDMGAAVRNLLRNGAGLSPGARLLVVHEPDEAGYYGAGIAKAVSQAAGALEYHVRTLERPFRSDLTEPDADTLSAMAEVNLTLFLARMGDQIRFRPGARHSPIAICYALDPDLLASAFGRIDHRAMIRLRDLIDRAHRTADVIRITCPAGTDLEGSIPPEDTTEDTRALRFPLSVHTPVSCTGFSGRIAQRGFLVGTGSSFYEPYAIGIEGTLLINIDKGRITGFEGQSAEAARAHYLGVAERFDIDPWRVHSWHGGIHPACSFPSPASDSFERWSGGAFGNPRLLHFHTCGDYAPGEICLNLLDPTVTLDGIPVRNEGSLLIGSIPGAREELSGDGELVSALSDPARECGEIPAGGLGFR